MTENVNRKRKRSRCLTLEGTTKKKRSANIVVDDDMTIGAVRDEIVRKIGSQSSMREIEISTTKTSDKVMAKNVSRKRKGSRCLTLEGTTKAKRSENIVVDDDMTIGAMTDEIVRKIGSQRSKGDISTAERSKLQGALKIVRGEVHADTKPNGTSSSDHSVAKKSNGVEKDAEEKSVMKNEENTGTSFKLKMGADPEIVQTYFSPGKSSSRFRPRKEVHAFRMVDLSEDDDARIVDKRIKVYWPESRRWFTGLIKSFDDHKRMHNILYDDGDKEVLDLRTERFELEIMPTEGFRLRDDSTFKKKVGRLGGDEVNKSMLQEETFKIVDAERVMKSPETKKNNASKKVGKKGNLKLKRKSTKVKQDLAVNIDLDALSDNANKVIVDEIWAAEEHGKAHFSFGNSSSRLRPRKEVAAFRMVNLNEDDNARIVGKRIKIYWPESRRWFTGHIKSFNGQKRLHNILYEDGDKEELDLRKERFELEIMPTEGFRLAAESTFKMKVGGLGGDEVKRSTLQEGAFKIAVAESLMKSPETKKNNASKMVGRRGNLKLKRKSTNVKQDLAVNIDLDVLSDNANKVIVDEIRAAEEHGKAYFSFGNSSSRLRPRKEVAAFRMVNLNEDDNARIVGKRIKVYWPESRRWFTGQIKSFDEQKMLHNILYEDGDKEELDLRKERFELEVMPTEGFCLKDESTFKKKVGRLGGDDVSKLRVESDYNGKS